MKVLLLTVALGGVFLFLVTIGDGKTSEITRADENFAVALMGKCLHDGSSLCYRNAGDELFRKFEVPVILEIFERNEDKQAIFSRCHEVTHYLGRQEFMRTKSVPEAFQNVFSVCHGGAFHGVIEGYFDYKDLSLNDTALLENEIRNVCGERSDYELKTVHSECVHGIGHAMMFITEGELARSLEFCDSLVGRQDQTTCYGGVFMENSSSSTNLDHPSKYIKADDPLYPCNVLDEQYLETCYSYQSSHFAQISHHDWKKVIQLCQSVPESYQEGCFRIIGTNQVGLTQDMSVRKDNCELIPEERHRSTCFSGVIDALAGRYHQDFDMIVSFCALLNTEDKEGCYKEVGLSLLGWFPSSADLRKKCQTISEQKYIDACLTAIAV